MTTRGDVERLRSANVRVTELAKQRITELFAGIDFNVASPELVRDALLEVVPALVSEYGDLAASAAAEWYEEARAKQVAGVYRATLAERLPEEQITQSVRWAAGPLWDGNVELVASRLFGAVQRHLSYSTRQTIARNVARDPAKPRFARVPRGSRTCAFCMMLASRGFVYCTKETAGEIAGKYHDDCGCQIVSEWDKEVHHIEGYDPDALYGIYRQAAIDAQKADGQPPSDRRILQEMRLSGVSTDQIAPPIAAALWTKPKAPSFVLSDKNLRHVLDGEGKDITKGGHRSGLERLGKTEFPPNWSDADIARAIEQVITFPQWVRTRGKMTYRRAEINRVIIEVQSIEDKKGPRFHSAFPKSGDEVIRNDDTGKTSLPIKRNVLLNRQSKS